MHLGIYKHVLSVYLNIYFKNELIYCWRIQEKPYTLETSGLPDFIKYVFK
jgi:hypothetical protein